MRSVDCYVLLGIKSDADDKAIRKAWRRKTKEVHPDVNPSENAAKQFRELTEAMELLLDPVSRLQHDREFGYYRKMPGQGTHTKENFSDYQKNKAKNLVKEWTEDYNIAMVMREMQRQKAIKKHKRNIALVVTGILVLVVLAVLWMVLG